jgi:hypothetical protein
MEDPTKDKKPNIKDYSVLKEYEDVFVECQDSHPRETLTSLLI